MRQSRYKKVVDSLVEDIRSGIVSPGTRLPAHRELAREKGIALATASRVYAELERMGLVIGEVGRGTFVRNTPVASAFSVDQQAVEDNTVDLNFNYPSTAGQGDILRKALRRLASSGDIEALLRYQPHAGRPHERESIAGHLQSRGLNVDPSTLMIVDGAQHGLATIAIALFKPGDVVAIDSLSYPGFKVLANSLRLELAPVPFGIDGPNLDALDYLCESRRVRAVYLQPTVHNPLGWVMSLRTRADLVRLIRNRGLLVIEDAPYAFLEVNAPSPIAALAPEATIYVSSFSKSVATGLRVGFVVAPSPLVPAIERAIRATTWNTPGVMTAMICGWIGDGTVGRLENEKRIDARSRQLVVADVFEGMNYIAHGASYFLLLSLLDDVRADRVVKSLLDQNISVSTTEPFSTGRHVPNALRIALGSVDLSTLRISLQKIREVIEMHAYGYSG